MSHTRSHRRAKRTTAVVFGLAAGVLLATGLNAIALARGTSVKPRSAAITGSIRLKHTHVESGGTVRGQVVFQNRTSRRKVLMRGCKIDGLYAIGVRASDGSVTAPVFSLVGCSPEQEMVAKPGVTVYRFALRATYMGCSPSAKDQPPKGSKYWLPRCLKGSTGKRDVMPPLPAGGYTALFIPAGAWLGPRVKPAKLVITPRKIAWRPPIRSSP